MHKIVLMKKYWKAFFAVVFSISLGYSAHAQADTAKATQVENKLIDELCSCISKSNPDSVKTVDDIQNLMMKCTMSGDIASLFMQYMTASGFDLTDMQQMQNVMTKFGMEASTRCPAMMTMMMNVAKDSSQVNKMMEEYKNATGTGSSQPANKQ